MAPDETSISLTSLCTVRKVAYTYTSAARKVTDAAASAAARAAKSRAREVRVLRATLSFFDRPDSEPEPEQNRHNHTNWRLMQNSAHSRVCRTMKFKGMNGREIINVKI